ncbi:MAG: permease [Actinomycetota bacterium]|nr:permease [Actinomycetota bacterium]
MSHVLLDIARSLRESGFMLWETLWALVLGFTLSGAVQAFVSKEKMQARLGDHGPRAVVRASWYGMVSSSCSYAASAMTKSLFARGADFTTALIFMISSTNLVVELGIVMLVLLGWQFAVAEFVGGPVMIILLALVGTAVFSAPLVLAARSRVRERSNDVDDGEEMGTPDHSPRTLTGWSNASSYAVADATMLRLELFIGYLVAGFLAVTVPTSWWGNVFWHGHGVWTTLENAMVGPLIAVVSWVCSVGNVPLAAALWHGGISFGGVISFIFADLIAMPLILIYRKFYGGALTIRIVLSFYVVMVVAGLVTEILFRTVGAVPTSRVLHVGAQRLSWNYTTFLNILFVLVGAVVWLLARRRHQLGEASGYAIDPVCKMQVRMADAPARATLEGQTFYFCADRCRERFLASRDVAAHSAALPTSPTVALTLRPRSDADIAPVQSAPVAVDYIDPICGMHVTRESAAAQRRWGDEDVYFCAVGCATRFDELHPVR